MLSPRLSLSIGLAALALTAGATTASAETISISDGTAEAEGAATDHVKARFIVTRTRAQGEVDQGTYSLRVTPGTATEGADYVARDDDTSLSGGTPCASPEGCVDSNVFAVDIVGDDVAEPQENFFVNLTATGMTVTDPQGEGTILDDDAFAAPATVAAPQPVVAPAPVQQHVAAPAPAPATDDGVGPAMDMVFRGLRGNIAKVRIGCPADEVRCVGRLAVQLNEKTMASAPFRLHGGQKRLMKIRLTRKQRRTLHDAGVVYLKASAFDAAGNRFARVLSFGL